MTFEKIPQQNAVLLVRALGLLGNQASVYGPAHKVTQSAARSVYAELEQVIRANGPVEISLKDNRVLINGSTEGLDVSAGRNLLDRMILHKVEGIVFLAPPELNEFLTCITLFGTSPAALAAQGGFEVALKRAGLKSVRVVTVAYRRVDGNKPATPPAWTPPDTPKAPDPQRIVEKTGSGVLDLSSAWAGGFGTKPEEPEEGAALTAATVHKERTAALAALLRDAAALLDNGEALSEREQQRNVLAAINRVRDVLVSSTRESERQIALLADQVDEDRQTIASIESAARRRGIGLKLSRGELVERYAELNQEIVQPLTVSTGVIDMLHSGKGGPLTTSQRDLLQLAADSVERVNQLVAYMRRIAGLPESYTPDSDIIADSYR